jgi:twitching motility two-component system response regulator PilH
VSATVPTVVIADDSPTLRRIVSSVLEGQGYDVTQATDGVEAVQAVFRVQPDAIVLDVQMPRVSGYVACRLLKDDWQTADIPVVLLTSLDAASDRYWGTKTGADAYLTKDFEAPELAGTVADVIAAAAASRGGRPALKADAVDLSDDDVLAKVCDLLDRKLFETSVAAEVTGIAATTHGFEETVEALMDVVRRFVDYHLAAVVLHDEKQVYVSVKHESSDEHLQQFLTAAADALASYAGTDYNAVGIEPKVDDPDGVLGEDDAPMATFLSMPLRGGGGRVVGVLALSSSVKNGFSETSLETLKLLEGPAAIVIDNARLAFSATG